MSEYSHLLQAIARVNRVAKHKYREFIVDYIGLANHLHDALSIYSREGAADNEVDKVMPRYRQRKQWLRRNGAGLVI